MVALLLTLVVTCSPAMPENWSEDQGAFRLTSKLASSERSFEASAELTLAERSTGKVRWRTTGPARFRGQVVVAANGRHAAILEGDVVLLMDARGKERARISVASHLTEQLRRRGPLSPCGPQYVSGAQFGDGELTVFLPWVSKAAGEGAGAARARLVIRLDTQKVEVLGVPQDVSTAGAVTAWESADGGNARVRAAWGVLEALRLEGTAGAHPKVIGTCRAMLGDSQTELQLAGLECLRTTGTPEDVARLAEGNFPPEISARVFGTLGSLKYPRLDDYAWRVLKERREPAELRTEALQHLFTKPSPLQQRLAAIALADEAPAVRTALVHLLSYGGGAEVAWRALVDLSLGAPSPVRDRARATLLHRFFVRREECTRERLDEFDALVRTGPLGSWASAWVVLGGMAESRPALAEAAYRRALELQPDPSGDHEDRTLWAEAALRLAQMFAEQGRRDEALGLANRVAGLSGSGVTVQAPRVNSLSLCATRERSGMPRPAGDVAKLLLEDLAPKAKERTR